MDWRGRTDLFAGAFVLYQLTLAATTPQVFTDEWFFGADSYRAAITDFHRQNPFAGWQIKKHPLYVAITVPLHRMAAAAYRGMPDPYRQNFALAFPVALLGAINLCVAHALFVRIGFRGLTGYGATILYGLAASIWYFAAYPDTYICTALLTNVFLLVYFRDRESSRWGALSAVNVLACFSTPQQIFLAMIPCLNFLRREGWRVALRRAAGYGTVLVIAYMVPFVALTAMDWHAHIDVHRLGFVQTELKNWSSPNHLVSAHDWFSVLASFLLLSNVAAPIDLAGYTPVTTAGLATAPVSFWVLAAALGLYAVVGLLRRWTERGARIGVEIAAFCALYMAFFVYFNPREAFIYSGPLLLPLWLFVQRGYVDVQARRGWAIATVVLCAGVFVNNAMFAWDLQHHQDELPRLKTVRPKAAT